MIVGVVSDTHGNLATTRKATALLEELSPDLVFHCGDIGGIRIVAEFSAWPTHFVAGNVDESDAELAAAIAAAGQTFHGAAADLTLAGQRIAIIHGHDHRRLRAAVVSNEYDLICTGHTHRAERYVYGKTTVVNPGALHRAAEHTIALIDLNSRGVEASHHLIT
jgi:putative phosphoesterase